MVKNFFFSSLSLVYLFYLLDAHAVLEVKRSDLTIPSGAKVKSTARIDGEQVWSGDAVLGENGKLDIKFKLPERILIGEGTLNCVVQDGGTTESTGNYLFNC